MPSFFVSASSELALTSTGTSTINRLVSATTGLDLTSFCYSNLNKHIVSQTLSLSDSVSTKRTYAQSITQPFFISQSCGTCSAIRKTVTQTLSLVSSGSSNVKILETGNLLNFAQSVATKEPKRVNALTNITTPLEVDLTGVDLTDPEAIIALFAAVGLRQSVTLRKIDNISVTSVLTLHGQASPTQELSTSSHIHLSDELWTGLFETPHSVLQLVQTAVGVVTEPVTSTLSLSQSLEGHGVIGRQLTSTLDLDNIVSFYRIAEICTYDPGVGAGGPAPSMIDPVITRRSTIILTFPYILPTLTFEVRNPIFDDTEQYEYRKINRKTRGGTLKMYRNSMWPSSERLIYTFTILKETEKQALLYFMQQSIGKEIGLLDYESRQWRGVLLTPTTQINEDRRSGSTVTIEFEGTVDPGGLQAVINATGRVTPNVRTYGSGLYADMVASSVVGVNLTRT